MNTAIKINYATAVVAGIGMIYATSAQSVPIAITSSILWLTVNLWIIFLLIQGNEK